MKKIYVFFVSIMITVSAFGQGFALSNINWSCPDGGQVLGGVNQGLWLTGNTAGNSHDIGSQSWSLVDMNGDGLSDLVITSEKQGANVTSFSPTSNQFWKVYLNTGLGFSSSQTNWSCPDGGQVIGGVVNGFIATAGAASGSHDIGSQSWSLVDMNGDDKPDLVITSEKQGSNVTSFSPGSNQFWKVYLNTGSGFSSSQTNWSCPAGGQVLGGVLSGFWLTGNTASNSHDMGSQSWSLVDMNGDNKPDLVVTSEKLNTDVTSFSPTSNQFWKVYLNTGTGFSASQMNWSCPDGGQIISGVVKGFFTAGNTASNSHDVGSQSWSLTDMDNDGKPDLVVTSEKQGSNVTSFSPTSNQFWKVYFNNGSGFSASQTNWPCPDGGQVLSGVAKGFFTTGNTAGTSHDVGSQSWSLMDIDGDNKPDLVVTSEKQGSNVTSFSPTSNQFWKAYLNNGAGFSVSQTNWSCPNGGRVLSGVVAGFYIPGGVAGSTHDMGSQSWSVVDMNNDDKPDLVVTSEKLNTDVTSFSPSSNQFWKVYLNTSAVGVVENENHESYAVFPNPALEGVTLKSAAKGKVVLYNTLGQVMREADKREAEMQIDLNAYPKGVYWLRFEDRTFRLVKQ